MTDINDQLEKLKKENEEYKNKIKVLEDKLKKYTNTDRHKRYYEKNKEKIKQNAKKYMERMRTENPDKLKEWRRNAYLKRKEK
jgi:cell division septum initiation protein DivIVA